MDVQFTSSCLEVNIAKRLQTTDFQLRKLDKNAPVPGETVEVDIALPIQIRTHLLDLKIGHIAESFAQRTLMRFRAAELKALKQTSMRQHLSR